MITFDYILRNGANISIGAYMTSGILICLYYAFFIMLLIFVGSLFKKSIIAGIIVLLTNYLTSAISSLKVFKAYSPYKLITSAGAFSTEGIAGAIIFVVLGCIILAFVTTLRLKKFEVV